MFKMRFKMRKIGSWIVNGWLGLALLLPATAGFAQSKDFSSSRFPNLTQAPFVQELQLSDEQKSQMQKIYEANRETLEGKRESLREAKAKFEEAMAGTESDSTVRDRHRDFVEAR